MKSSFTTLYSLYFLIAGAVSCGPGSMDVEILASFSFNPKEEILVGNTVHFINESVNTNESAVYTWDFGDGNSSVSENPSHSYTKIGEGTYEVILTVKQDDVESVAKKSLAVSLNSIIDGRKTLVEKLSDNKIMTCAHRANVSSTNAPENSITAIKGVIAENIGMIEIDVRETKDGKLVLMHDATIDRTTNGSGKVNGYSLKELKEYKLYDKNGILTDERMPTLEEVLLLARGNLYIDLDISSKANFSRVYPVIKQYGMVKQVLFYSSSITVIRSMIDRDSNVIAMARIRNESDFDNYSSLDLKVVHYGKSSFYQSLVQKAKDKGWYVFILAYVNTSMTPDNDAFTKINTITSLMENGIVQTDYPVLVKRHLK